MAGKEKIMTAHFDPDGNPLRSYSVRPPTHPLLPNMLPSEVNPHIEALETAGIYGALTQEQQATIIRLMQAAYRNGQASRQAEKIDDEAVWVNGIGMIERQPDDTWIVTGYDAAKDAEMIRAREAELGVGFTPEQYNDWAKSYHARVMGQSRSEAKISASRENGKKGGRPTKLMITAQLIHFAVCGCDDKTCTTESEIYDWLKDGDQGKGRTLTSLIEEWRDRENA